MTSALCSRCSSGRVPALLSLVAGTRVHRARPLAALVVVCGLLALGKHFFMSRWVLEVPPFSSFRYPVKYAVGSLFGLSLLAGFGARRLVTWWRRDRRVALRLMLALGAGALGLLVAARLPGAREGLREGAWWLVAAAGGLALTFSRPAALAALVAVELVARGARTSAGPG